MPHPTQPEILSPAGSLDKLKTSILYGADAVYFAGQEFGLRTAADNFTVDEIFEGIQFAHERGVKCYVALNAFLHDQDLERLPSFLLLLEVAGVDAVIVSDLGVMEIVRKYSRLPIHLSTQASCLNAYAAEFWKDRGVKRLVLGREVSIKEAQIIKERSGLEVELFVHGSMCMAYSGHCTISNFTQGRDSNRGGCAHSCRFDYSVDFDPKNSDSKIHDQKNYDPEKQNIDHSFFMSSKDLSGVHLVPQLLNSGIDAFKVEGRMKSVLYTAVATRTFKEALKISQQGGDPVNQEIELLKIANRGYTTGNLIEKANGDSILPSVSGSEASSLISSDSAASSFTEEGKTWSFAGEVLEVVKDRFILLEVRNAFSSAAKMEILPWSGPAIRVTLGEMADILGNPLERTNVNRVVRIPFIKGIEAGNVARMLKEVR